MSNFLTCKHCNISFDVKQFGRHLNKMHGQKYEDYVKNNLDEFRFLGWKLCKECGLCFKGRSEKCGMCFTRTHKINFNQYIICGICDQSVHSKVMSIHLKSQHNIELLDYIKENLIDFDRFGWCKCGICGIITKKQGSKHLPTCSSSCRNQMILREYSSGWAPRVGKLHTEQSKKKISLSNSGKKHPTMIGNLNPACRTEVRNKISRTRIDRMVAKGEKNPMFGKIHTPEAIQKIFSHRQMNKLEKRVADELDKNGIEYIFQFFINNGDICKSYDFKIKDRPIIIEVDGDFWHGNPNVKYHFNDVHKVKKNDLIKEEIANSRGYRVIRLWESDINKDISIVMNSIK